MTLLCKTKIIYLMQPPSSTCSYQGFNYTFQIVDMTLYKNISLHILGPFHHQGSGNIDREFGSILERNKTYSLKIDVSTLFYDKLSYTSLFGKCFHFTLISCISSAEFKVYYYYVITINYIYHRYNTCVRTHGPYVYARSLPCMW